MVGSRKGRQWWDHIRPLPPEALNGRWLNGDRVPFWITFFYNAFPKKEETQSVHLLQEFALIRSRFRLLLKMYVNGWFGFHICLQRKIVKVPPRKWQKFNFSWKYYEKNCTILDMKKSPLSAEHLKRSRSSTFSRKEMLCLCHLIFIPWLRPCWLRSGGSMPGAGGQQWEITVLQAALTQTREGGGLAHDFGTGRNPCGVQPCSSGAPGSLATILWPGVLEDMGGWIYSPANLQTRESGGVTVSSDVPFILETVSHL